MNELAQPYRPDFEPAESKKSKLVDRVKNTRLLSHAVRLVGGLSLLVATGVINPPDISADAPTPIIACQEIKAPGSYILDRDIQTPVGKNNCINIHDVSGVNLDCNWHTIGAGIFNETDQDYQNLDILNLTNVTNFSVQKCHIISNIAPEQSEQYHQTVDPLGIRTSQHGVFTNNDFGFMVSAVANSTDIKFSHNRFNGIYQQNYSSSMTIENNVFAQPTRSVKQPIPAVVISNFGTHNQIINNLIEGNSDGNFNPDLNSELGADDGIVLGDESFDFISGNTILNNFDCGIETTGTITNTIIKGNVITNSGYCGIGGWYWNSWSNNIVEGNTVQDAPRLFQFNRIYGLRTGENAIYFSDNKFIGNRLSNQTLNTIWGAYSTEIEMSPSINPSIPDNLWVLRNNSFSKNDFGAKDPIILRPISMFIDKGGNRCSPNNVLRCLSQRTFLPLIRRSN